MESLVAGYEFPPVSYQLTYSIVDGYQKAVESGSLITGLVPPLAVAAYALKAMYTSFLFPPGSIHAAQEFEFRKPVAVGSQINYQAKVVQIIERTGMIMVVIELNASDENNDVVLRGKTTVVLPA
jgi:acyl dehydratase